MSLGRDLALFWGDSSIVAAVMWDKKAVHAARDIARRIMGCSRLLVSAFSPVGYSLPYLVYRKSTPMSALRIKKPKWSISDMKCPSSLIL